MTVDAVVREWHPDEGWGVIEAAETPGGCWAHFSHVATAGYRELTPGDAVNLDWETADQDGYSYRAVRVWPTGADPVEEGSDSSSTAYGSRLTIGFDGESTGESDPDSL